jgi:hypothetical protein
MMDAEIGALTQLKVAVDPSFSRVSGKYFNPIARVSNASKLASDEVLQDALWDWTEAATTEYWQIDFAARYSSDINYRALWMDDENHPLKEFCSFVDLFLCNKVARDVDNNADSKLDFNEFSEFAKEVDLDHKNGISYSEASEYLLKLHNRHKGTEIDSRIFDYFFKFLNKISLHNFDEDKPDQHEVGVVNDEKPVGESSREEGSAAPSSFTSQNDLLNFIENVKKNSPNEDLSVICGEADPDMQLLCTITYIFTNSDDEHVVNDDVPGLFKFFEIKNGKIETDEILKQKNGIFNML